MICNIREYGAQQELANNAPAIQAAIDACHGNGGGMVHCPPGDFTTGTIMLKTNVELHLAAGCTLKGSPRKEDYQSSGAPYDQDTATESASGTHLICAYRQRNIAITGAGTINGNGPSFFGPQTSGLNWEYKGRWRPGQMVALLECENVRIENITLINSTYWTIWPYACNRVRIHGITINNDTRTPNGDGMDPDCCADVVISDCNITAGDDGIALRANQVKAGINKPLENVVITNCIINTPWYGGIRLGPSGDQSVIRNIAVGNCVIKNAGKGILVSLWHRPPRWDYGVLIENVTFSNMVINAISPFRMYVEGACRAPCGIRGIMLQNIMATGANTSGFIGNNRAIFEDIRLHNIHLSIPEFQDRIHGNLALEHRNHGFYFKHVKNLVLSDTVIHAGPAAHDSLKSAVYIEHVQSARLANMELRGIGPANGIITEECSETTVENIR